MEFLHPKVTTRSRRSAQSLKLPRSLRDEGVPTRAVHLKVANPCAGCKIPGDCPVPAYKIQVPIQCMVDLMKRHRTWACPYNLNSWCTYQSATHSCYAQDDAPEAPNHQAVLEYRDLEQKYWLAFTSQRPNVSKAAALAARVSTAKKRILAALGQRSLSVCAFWSYYKDQARLHIANKPAKEIPMLLHREVIAIKGRPFRV